MSMISWFRNLFTRTGTRTGRKAPQRTRPALEVLEDRLVPTTGPVGYWLADNSTADLTGNNNGALVGGANYAAGYSGQAFNLDGSNAVTLPGSVTGPLAITGTDLTVAAWINLNTYTSPNGNQTIFDKYHDGVVNGYMLGVHNNGHLLGWISTPSSPNFSFGGGVPVGLNTWVHVAMTYDGATARLYVNGVQTASTALTGNITHNSLDARIGNDNGGMNAFGLNGRIDNLGVWDRTLSPSEIAVEAGLVVTSTTVTADDATYDGNPHGATAAVTPGLPAGTVTFLYTGTGSTVYSSSDAPTNAGTYHVVASFTPDDPAAFTPSSGFANFTIGKAPASVSVSPTTFTYNGAEQSHGAYVVSGVGSGITQDVTWTYVGDRVNAGTYTARAAYAGDANRHGSDSGFVTMTIKRATLTGNAATQDALNTAKQGKLTITVSTVAGLVNGDTLAAVLGTAEFYLTVGTNRYVFVPTTVTTSDSGITIAYSLKDSALAAALAAELADNTSAATSVTGGFLMESLNYTLSDDDLTRLFSTAR